MGTERFRVYVHGGKVLRVRGEICTQIQNAEIQKVENAYLHDASFGAVGWALWMCQVLQN